MSERPSGLSRDGRSITRASPRTSPDYSSLVAEGRRIRQSPASQVRDRRYFASRLADRALRPLRSMICTRTFGRFTQSGLTAVNQDLYFGRRMRTLIHAGPSSATRVFRRHMLSCPTTLPSWPTGSKHGPCHRLPRCLTNVRAVSARGLGRLVEPAAGGDDGGAHRREADTAGATGRPRTAPDG